MPDGAYEIPGGDESDLGPTAAGPGMGVSVTPANTMPMATLAVMFELALTSVVSRCMAAKI